MNAMVRTNGTINLSPNENIRTIARIKTFKTTRI